MTRPEIRTPISASVGPRWLTSRTRWNREFVASGLHPFQTGPAAISRIGALDVHRFGMFRASPAASGASLRPLIIRHRTLHVIGNALGVNAHGAFCNRLKNCLRGHLPKCRPLGAPSTSARRSADGFRWQLAQRWSMSRMTRDAVCAATASAPTRIRTNVKEIVVRYRDMGNPFDRGRSVPTRARACRHFDR